MNIIQYSLFIPKYCAKRALSTDSYDYHSWDILLTIELWIFPTITILSKSRFQVECGKEIYFFFYLFFSLRERNTDCWLVCVFLKKNFSSHPHRMEKYFDTVTMSPIVMTTMIFHFKHNQTDCTTWLISIDYSSIHFLCCYSDLGKENWLFTIFVYVVNFNCNNILCKMICCPMHLGVCAYYQNNIKRFIHFFFISNINRLLSIHSIYLITANQLKPIFFFFNRKDSFS